MGAGRGRCEDEVMEGPVYIGEGLGGSERRNGRCREGILLLGWLRDRETWKTVVDLAAYPRAARIAVAECLGVGASVPTFDVQT